MAPQPGDLQSFLSSNLWWGCAYVHMCAPTLAQNAPVILVLFTARIISVLLFDTRSKAGCEKRLMRPPIAQTQLKGGVLWPASGCQQDASLKLAILLISHYLVSALAAGLTFSHCKKNQTFVHVEAEPKALNGICSFGKCTYSQCLHKPVVGGPAERDNTGKTMMLWQSWPGSCLSLVQLFTSRQHQIKPVAEVVFHRGTDAAHTWFQTPSDKFSSNLCFIFLLSRCCIRSQKPGFKIENESGFTYG